MSASSRDLSIPDGLILFLPAVPGMLFLYIAEVIHKVCAGLGLELGLSGYALLEAVFIGCALSPAAGLSGFLLPLLIALGLLVPLMTGISAGICRLARRRIGR